MSIELDIFKDFGDFQLDVSFRHGKGVLGLLGASGCGKSLTMKCIAGIVTPDKGRILVDDRVFFDSEKKINVKVQDRNIGYLFQSYVLFPNMTALENLKSGMGRVKASERSELLNKVIDMFFLRDYLDLYPHQLSGGQKQRVAIGRMLASKPNLIMLDEPLSALDSYLKHQVEKDLLELLDFYDGKAIYVSHNRDEINRFCDEVGVMENGKIMEMVSKEELFTNPKHLSTAKLSGCKNFSRAEMTENEQEIRAVDWNLVFSLKRSIPENTSYIGLRSHHLGLSEQAGINRFKIEIDRVLENLFDVTILFRPKSKKVKSHSLLRMDIDKKSWENFKDKKDLYCKVDDEKILLLRS